MNQYQQAINRLALYENHSCLAMPQSLTRLEQYFANTNNVENELRAKLLFARYHKHDNLTSAVFDAVMVPQKK